MNKATRTIVATLGTIFGVSGMSHGFFEILQGNIPTGGWFISAIGEAQKMWVHGDEPALTLIPNFMVTGIIAMLLGLALVIWSLRFVQGKRGPFIFLLLFILLLFLGGGVAQVLFFPWIWLVSTRINKPLSWWQKVLAIRVRQPLGILWPWLLAVSSILLVFVLEVAVTGFVPGVNDPEVVLSIMLASLAVEVILLPLTFISGFAYDLVLRTGTVLEA